jgi:eukaryotic-like serine/threonine-protein kinase
MGEKKLDRFGKYLLLDHLLDGGMNRIFRARYLGDTASKICAVKVVLPQYSQDPQFKIMFMDEIRVTFGLLHPNIVQTYDYGTHKGQLYVAMEYCDGRNLKEYLDKLKERKFVFPVEISVYIGTQICQGLHYAHTLSDKLSGKDMNIIHRDISPHNIMLTYDGGIKIIDFGIAKAETNSEATQAGTIKGKLSYLAPEYLEGNELDSRYDQFAVGITLWEMLCNRKLFKAPNDIAVLKKIQECEVPKPSSINPNVSPELDEIILKSLSKNPENRFENMDMLNRALIKFLYSKYPDFNATDLSYFAKELFKEHIQKDREKLFGFGKIELGPYINDMKAEARGELDADDTIQTSVNNSDEESDKTQVKSNTVFDFGFSDDGDERTKSGTRILDRKKIKKELKRVNHKKIDHLSLGDENTGKANKKDQSIRKETNPQGKEYLLRSPRSKSVSQSRVLNVKTTSKSNSLSKLKLMVATISILLGAGYFFKIRSQGDSRPRGIASNKIESKNGINHSELGESREIKKGRIEFNNYNKYAQRVFINGQRVSVDVLGFVNDVSYGEHYLRVEEDNYENFVEIISISDRSDNLRINIPKMKLIKVGYLEVSQDCFRGEIEFELFGETRTETIPFEGKSNIGFPVGGPDGFSIVYRSEGEDLKQRVEFTINKSNDVVDFCQMILE